MIKITINKELPSLNCSVHHSYTEVYFLERKKDQCEEEINSKYRKVNFPHSHAIHIKDKNECLPSLPQKPMDGLFIQTGNDSYTSCFFLVSDPKL